MAQQDHQLKSAFSAQPLQCAASACSWFLSAALRAQLELLRKPRCRCVPAPTMLPTCTPARPPACPLAHPPLHLQSAVTDSFAGQSDGGFWVSQMGDADGGTPGRMVRLGPAPSFTVVGEYPSEPPAGFNP